MKLFEFPRVIGNFEGDEVSVAIGRFGPYIKHDGKFVSVPKDIAPAEITIDEAIDLIEAKRREEKQRIVKTFDEDHDLQILNGKYGVYIAYKKSNYKIPKTVTDPSSLSLEQCMSIINDQDNKPKKAAASRRGSSRSKK